MRKTLLTGLAAAAALTLVTAAPAFAETKTETTVTTHSVPADTAIAIPYDYDVWWDAAGFAEDGAVEFPLEAEPYDGDFTHESFAMSAEAPEGCVRAVKSFTFGYTLADHWFTDVDAVSVAGGLGTGEPLEFASTDEASVIYSGDGEVEIESDRVRVELYPQPQSGAVTMTYPEPVAPADARGYIGFEKPDSTTWIVDHASFLVTDTCTSEVDVPVVLPPVVKPPVVKPPVVVPPVVKPPVVVPPVVEPPVVAPPVVVPPVVAPPVTVVPATVVTKQALAETGVDSGLAGAAAALLFGAGVAGLLLARRRA